MTERGTRKPCPGCGAERRRGINEVCHECKRLLAVARVAIEREAADEARVACALPFALYGYPHISGGGDAERRRVQQLFDGLARAVGEPAAAGWGGRHLFRLSYQEGSQYQSYGHDPPSVTLTIEQADLLEDLHRAVRALVESAAKEGQRRGQNLLVSLATGELTMGDFGERAARAGSAK